MSDTDNQQERLKDLSWLAGIIEGEGCFALHRANRGNSISPRVQVTNTNVEIITKMRRIVGSLGLAYYFRSFFTSNRPCYRLEIGGIKRVKRFIDVMYPFIECRRDQLDCVRAFVESRLSKPQHAPLCEMEIEQFNKLARLNRPFSIPRDFTPSTAINGDQDKVRPAT